VAKRRLADRTHDLVVATAERAHVIENSLVNCSTYDVPTRRVTARADALNSLSYADTDELLGHLFEQVVVLQRSYDRSRRGILFRPWLYAMLRRRAIDWARS
jgi:hypothetical protein